MSNCHRKSSHKKTKAEGVSKQYLQRNWIARSIFVLGLFTGINSLAPSAILAASTAPNVTIDNQATGTFTDGDDPSLGQESVMSNVVSVTVAEVAGISITSTNLPTPLTGSVANFDFKIQNVGNDPTQFFLPAAPSSITGGTAGTLQVIGYILAGGTQVNLATPINIATASTTGGLSDPTLGGNTTMGSIPADAAIVVRVPVTITATVGSSVVVTLGDTTGSPTNSNTPYLAGSNDLYTFDNPDGTVAGEATGVPLNGDAVLHRQEASAVQTVTVVAAPALVTISGTVFEDPSYGGGAGRHLNTSLAAPRPNARVELYDVAGVFKAFMLTDTNGLYKFDATNVAGGVVTGDYKVRVVNSTVSSSRLGYVNTLFPVQTFRTEATTGLVTDVTDRVGGEKPQKIDAPANTTNLNLLALNNATEEVQSLTAVRVNTSAVTGIDFGYNFDTIVNTNDAGQGSLRQFIYNSNALQNTSLSQVGQVAQQEVSIFMIPPSSGDPQGRLGDTGFIGGVAKIRPIEPLPTIIDDNTSIDGGTQTIYSGDTNAPITEVTTGPEIVIDGSRQLYNKGPGLQVAASGITIANLGITKMSGFGHLNLGAGEFGNRGTAILFSAGGSIKPAGTVISSTKLNLTDELINNVTAWDNGAAGLMLNSQSSASIRTVVIENSLFGKNGFDQLLGNGLAIADGISLDGNNSDVLIRNNTIVGNAGYGIDIANGNNQNNTISNNLIKNNGVRGSDQITQGNEPRQLAGIAFRAGNNSDNIVRQNIITGNIGAGIVASQGANQDNTFTRNSIYDNGGIGIDLGTVSTGNAGDGVTLNDLNDADLGNNGLLNFPVLEKATISGTNLIVTGYARSGSTIELFVSEPDTSGFGEGKTYLATFVEGGVDDSDATTGSYSGLLNGVNSGQDNTNRFKFQIPLTSLSGTVVNTTALTATATFGKNTSEFSGVVQALTGNPRILLVKRITALNGGTATANGQNLATYHQDDTNPYDDNLVEPALAPAAGFTTADTDNWPNTIGKNSSTFLIGAIAGVTIKPKDSIEYTIYFLSTGESAATNVLLCDRVPDNVTFVPRAFSNTSIVADTVGSVGVDRGIAVNLGGTLKSYTNSADGDFAQYFPPGIDPTAVFPKVNCGGTNTNGAIVVNLGDLPNATKPPTLNSYFGFVRFQGAVK
jgi:trimeric autotransporter adhesin